jgi:hypothetical protein
MGVLPRAGESDVSLAVNKVDSHSRANLVWRDSVLLNGLTIGSGIRGDGRNRTGQRSGILNEYQGNFCGVEAFTWDQRGEDGSLNPDIDVRYDPSTMSAACGSARQVAFFVGDATSIGTSSTWTGPHILIGGIWTFSQGESRVQPMTYGTQQVICRLEFDLQYAGAANARLTRLPDVQTTNGSGQTVTARQWRAESQGNHRAACLRLQPNGKYTDSGIRYFLPFSVTITQVPYPYPVYP